MSESMTGRFNNSGSILLEALLSVIILSVGITMVMQSMTSSLRAMVYSRHYTQASYLMEKMLMDLIRHGEVESPGEVEGDFEEFNGAYRYTISSEPLQDALSERLARVRLDVTWMSKNRDRSLSVETFMLQDKDQ